MKRLFALLVAVMLPAVTALSASAVNIRIPDGDFRQCGGYAFYDENGTITHGSYVIWSSVENRPDVKYDISHGFEIRVRDILWAEENTAITIVVGTPPDVSIDPSERTWIAIPEHIVFILQKSGDAMISNGASSILANSTPPFRGKVLEEGFTAFTLSVVRNETDTGWLLSVDDQLLIEYEDKFEGYESTRYGIYPVALTHPEKTTFGFGVLNGDALAMDAEGNMAYTVSEIRIAEALTVNQKTTGAFTGDTVTVSAPVVDGKAFTGWVTEGIDLGENASSAEVEFEMPANAVTLQATYDGEIYDFTETTAEEVTTDAPDTAGNGTVTGTAETAPVTTDAASAADSETDGNTTGSAVTGILIGVLSLFAAVIVVLLILLKKKKK